MTSFGASLRQERELRGVSLQEIAAATKIGVRMLQAIEDDRLDKLPQGLFVRGFVREYARFLALDEQKILTELSYHSPEAPVSEQRAAEPGSNLSSKVGARLTSLGIGASVFTFVAALILSPGLSDRGGAPDALPAVDAPAPTANLPGMAKVASDLTAGATQASTTSVIPQPLQLTLTATEDCWIGLDVGGDRVQDRVLRKGESFSITAKQNASLAVGNAGGLLIAIDSGPARPLGNRGEVKRNIPLSPEALGALSAGSLTTPPRPIG